MKKMNGGIETIVGTVILVGIVIALIIATILPAAKETEALGDAGTGRIDGLTGIIDPDHR